MRFIFIHWDGNRDWFSTWNSSSNCDSADNLSYETMSSSNCDSAEDLHMRLWRCITYQVNFSHYLATEWTFSTLFFCYQLYLLSAIGISALMAYVVGNALSFIHRRPGWGSSQQWSCKFEACKLSSAGLTQSDTSSWGKQALGRYLIIVI